MEMGFNSAFKGLMIKRLMLDGKVAAYCESVRYTPNRIHGKHAEFVNTTYILTVSLVTIGFEVFNYFKDFFLSRFHLISP
jgi:hypothetical protein